MLGRQLQQQLLQLFHRHGIAAQRSQEETMIAPQTAAAYASSRICLRGKRSKSWSDWEPKRASTLCQIPQYGTMFADSPRQRYDWTALRPHICSMLPAHAPRARVTVLSCLHSVLHCSAAVQNVTATHVCTNCTWTGTGSGISIIFILISCRAALATGGFVLTSCPISIH